MAKRLLATLVVSAGLTLGGFSAPAQADNPMGYRLLGAQEAASLPRNGGAIGLSVGRAQQLSDSGMTFDLMRVMRVRPGSPSAQAGFRSGDDIIAVDGRVFPTIAAFAAYIGSVSPGTQAVVDYIPSGGGPAQAQRVSVVVGAAGRPAQPAPPSSEGGASTGMSTGSKVAIGAAAAALIGCYELGCFSHRRPARTTAPTATGQQQDQPEQQQGAQPLR